MRIDQALAVSAQLEGLSDSPKLDVELLLCAVLDKPRSYLFTWPDKTLTDIQLQRFNACVQRRLTGEPIAHIVGHTGFWTLQLDVSADTLIPRPETELLVELALAKLPVQPCQVADLGTGTGAIALALASERPQDQVVGCDRIAAAVALAEHNRRRLQLHNVRFCEGSWFEPLATCFEPGSFELIVSNPPYIDPQDPHLVQGDVRFEPASALTAADAGMADIRHIASQARHWLKAGGWLMFEHGYDQGPVSTQLLQTLGYTNVETVKDYGARDRVTLGRWNPEGVSDAE
ncbi:MAG: peptide chain release factor N(5)-glutamine methyltransferase [Marinobacterium sp.]|nr:peptide chain release factor N(5)-glutamine methyltransferase [Marinobacterium sp.]